MKYLIIILFLSTHAMATQENDIINLIWHELGHPSLPKEAPINFNAHPSITSAKTGQPRKKNNERKVESHGVEYRYYDEEVRQVQRSLPTRKTIVQREKDILAIQKRLTPLREKYLKNISKYQRLTSVQSKKGKASSPFRSKIILRNSAIKKDKEYFVIQNAFDVRIKDQSESFNGNVHTTSSAIEILLRQAKSKRTVSNRYIAKVQGDTCKDSSCFEVSSMFKSSLTSSSFDIPTERSCPTEKSKKNRCQKGQIKIDAYSEVNTFTQLATSINKGLPVIAKIKLTRNFYNSKGIITYQHSLVNGKINPDLNYHTILLIGYMKLPKKLGLEGENCYLTINNWSQGWGAGGYACITEKWLSNYRTANHFIVLEKIRSI